jgi:hypothetical protein
MALRGDTNSPLRTGKLRKVGGPHGNELITESTLPAHPQQGYLIEDSVQPLHRRSGFYADQTDDFSRNNE